MSRLNQKVFYLLTGTIWLVASFTLDLMSPLGISDGLLYLPLILLTIFTGELFYSILAGMFATLCIILGYVFSPRYGSLPSVVFSNHIFSVLSVWITVALIYVYRRSEKNATFYRERLSALFKRVGEGIIIVNKQGRILLANQRATEIFGFSESEILDLYYKNILPSMLKNGMEDPGYILNFEDEASISGKEQLFLAKKNNGNYFPATSHIWSFNYNGINHYVFFILDITEKTKQEEALLLANTDLKKLSEELKNANFGLEEKINQRTKEIRHVVEELKSTNNALQQQIMDKEEAVVALNASQLMLETIALNFPNGIMSVLDRDFRYLYVHGQEIKNLGLSQQELIGTLFLPLRNPDVNDSIKTILLQVFEGENISFEYQNPVNHNYYLFNAAPLQDKKGTSEEVLVVSQNITVLKKAENDIRKSLEREHELNDMKSRFVTTASHEFKTPLSTILTSAALLMRYNNLADETRRTKHINRISSAVINLTEILNNFLSLEKMEEGKMRNEPAPFNIHAFCEELIDELSILTKPGQELKLTNTLKQPEVRLDKNLLHNILVNLLSNAIKYSDAGSVVFFDIKEENNQSIFSVKDTGIGIPKEEQKNLFNTFSRASNAENIEGTGMGLHIVKKYLELMNGTIEFESELNKGSCFTLKFQTKETVNQSL